MQSGGANEALLRETLRKGAPLVNVAIGDPDDNRNAELHSVGERIAESSALGLDFAEFVEDHQFWLVFERCRD